MSPNDAARTVVVDFPTFASCPSEIQLVGDAACRGGAIVLTDPVNGSVGAFWLTPPVDVLPQSKLFVTATIELAMGGTLEGDGFAFVAQATAAGASALGGLGDGLGFSGLMPSLAVSFDTYQNGWDPFAQTIGVHVNGDWMFPVQEAASPIDMTAAPFTIWIDYAQTTTIAAGTGAKPSPALVSTPTLAGVGSPVWFGMTASCGSAVFEHRVLSLRIELEP